MFVDKETLTDKIALFITAVMFFLVTAYGETSFITVLFVGSAAIILLFKTKGHIEIQIEPYYIFGILMISFSGLSSIWALEPYYSNKMTRNLFVTFCCCVLIFVAYSKDQDTWPLMRSIKWGGYLMTLHQIRYYGFKQLLSMLVSMDRMTEMINANTLGMFIATCCVFEIMDIAKNKKMTYSSPLLIPAVLVISATQSRKALLILGIGVALSFCLYFIDRKHVFGSLVAVFLFAFVVYLSLKILNLSPYFAGIIKRMTMLLHFVRSEDGIGHSLETRQEMIQIGWQQFLKTPILGVGIDNAQVVARNQTGGRLSAYLHNNYIELLCGGGIVGFIIYYSRIIYVLFCLGNSYHSHNDNYYPCLILSVIILLMDYGFVSYFARTTQLYILLMFLQTRMFRKNNIIVQKKLESRFRYIKT